MTRVTTDVDALNDLFTSGVVSVFGDVFTLVAIMAAMLLLDWRLALIAFSVLPLIVLVTQWFRVHVRQTYRDVRVLDRAHQRVPAGEHHRDVDGAAVPPRAAELRRSSSGINDEHRHANVRSIFYYAVFYPAIEIVSALATACCCGLAALRVIEDTLTLGTLVAFIQYAQRFFRPIQDLSEKFNVLQGGDGLVRADFRAARHPGGDRRRG